MKYWSPFIEENKDRITNPDFQTIRDNFPAKEAARKAEAEKQAEIEKENREQLIKEREAAKKEREEAKKEREAAEKRARFPRILDSELTTCEFYIKQSLKDPRSYRKNNSLYQIKETGLIDFTAKNSFGGVVRRVFDCNSFTFRD